MINFFENTLRIETIYRLLLVPCLILSYLTFSAQIIGAQEQDTTKIQLGNKKIIIIDDEDNENLEGVEKLKNGKQEFKAEILEFKTKIDNLKNEINKLDGDKIKKQEYENEISEIEKKIAALKEGISKIEDEIAILEDNENNSDEDADENDDEKFNWNNWNEEWFKFKRRKRNFDGHWEGVDIGLNNFVTKDYSTNLPDDAKFMELNTSKSWGISINPIEYNINLFKSYIGILTGLGFQFNNYRFDNNVTLGENDEGVIENIQNYSTPDIIKDYNKNTLNTIYLTAPILFEFQIPTKNDNKRVYLATGIIGGLKLHSKTKQIYKENGKKHKDKIKEDYQLSPLTYGLTARIGYRGLKIFANYNLSPLFEENKGPELYPFMVGISFGN